LLDGEWVSPNGNLGALCQIKRAMPMRYRSAGQGLLAPGGPIKPRAFQGAFNVTV